MISDVPNGYISFKMTKEGIRNKVLCDHDLVNLIYYKKMQIIDSGVALHITSKKEFFISYTPCNFGVLNTGNDDVSKVCWKLLTNQHGNTIVVQRS